MSCINTTTTRRQPCCSTCHGSSPERTPANPSRTNNGYLLFLRREKLRAESSASVSFQKKPYTATTVLIERLTSEEYEENDYGGLPELIESIKLQDSGPAEASRAIRKKLFGTCPARNLAQWSHALVGSTGMSTGSCAPSRYVMHINPMHACMPLWVWGEIYPAA